MRLGLAILLAALALPLTSQAEEVVFKTIGLRDLIRKSASILVVSRADPFVISDGRSVPTKSGGSVVWSEARYRFTVSDVLTARPDLAGRLRGRTITVEPADMVAQFEAFSRSAREIKAPSMELQRYEPAGDKAFENDTTLILFVKPMAEDKYAMVVTGAFESIENRKLVEEAIDSVHAERLKSKTTN